MFHRTKWIVFFISIIFMIIACSTEDSGPTQPPDPPTEIEKSVKRGLAYNLEDATDLDTLKSWRKDPAVWNAKSL